MVKETRIILDPKDIRAILVECGECGGELRLSTAKSCHIPQECPYCQHRLKMETATSDGERLCHLLSRLSSHSPQRNYSVRLETLIDD